MPIEKWERPDVWVFAKLLQGNVTYVDYEDTGNPGSGFICGNPVCGYAHTEPVDIQMWEKVLPRNCHQCSMWNEPTA